MRETALYLRTHSGSLSFFLPEEAERKHIAFEALDGLESDKGHGVRCWTYARVDHGGETAFVLEAQAAGLKSFARDHGWSFVGSTCEAAPGGSLDRPGLREILAAAQVGKMEVLLVHSLSCLYRGRDLYSALKFVNQLKSFGVQVVCLKDRIIT